MRRPVAETTTRGGWIFQLAILPGATAKACLTTKLA